MRWTSSNGIASKLKPQTHVGASSCSTSVLVTAALTSKSTITPADANALRSVTLDDASDTAVCAAEMARPAPTMRASRTTKSPGPSGPAPSKVRATSMSSGGPTVATPSTPRTDVALATRYVSRVSGDARYSPSIPLRRSGHSTSGATNAEKITIALVTKP